MDLKCGLPAVVTGGASGLGRASAKALAAQGARVAIFDVSEAEGRAVADEIGGLFVRVDITDEQSVADGFAAAREAHGQERVLVHCAQVSRGGKTVSRDRASGALRMFAAEDYEFAARGILVASYRVAAHAALGMAASEPVNDDGERGTIILTSSVAAQDGQVGQIAYGSCKSGVNGLVLPMARDLMEFGIRVNAIMPGIFATPPMLRIGERAPEVFRSLAASVPFPNRLGDASEFASFVLELVRNGYLNGQAFRLDGAIRMPPR